MGGLKKSLLTLLLLLFAVSLKAQQLKPQAVFDQANTLLQQGKINQALSKYQQLTSDEHFSGALFINMGYVYLKLGKMGKAKYFFLRAKQFDETAKKAQNALQFVNSQLSHQSVALPPLPWEQALNWLQRVLGTAVILGIGLILLNIGIFGLIGNWFRKRRSSVIPKITISIAVLGALIILLSFYVDYREQRYSQAVMIAQKTNVLKKPTTDATLINKAYEGYRFTVDHQKSKNKKSWVYIEMSNGSQGWIRREEIMIL